MSEPAANPAEPQRIGAEPPAVGAGAVLRAARQRQGLHIAALAASIKVAPAKLEALEAGRYDELPDATFTRALAQSVCRVLKIDAQPVLAQLPSTAPAALDKVDGGLNAPFRERQGRVAPTEWLQQHQTALLLALLLLLAAAAFALLPSHWLARWLPAEPGRGSDVAAAPTVIETVPGPGATASQPPGGAPQPGAALPGAAFPPATSNPLATGTAPAASVAAPASPAPAASAAPAGSSTRVVAVQATWVQAMDGRGQVLLARTMQQGETFELVGPRPYRLRIGNVRGTELHDRGQPVELGSRTRDNVVNVELP